MRKRIGPYRIEKVIAEGGMGLVYKGHHDTLPRCAAIKTLLRENALDAAARQRLIHEAQAQALVKHDNVVAVYEFIPEDGELFIAMEYVDGETLTALLQRSPDARLTVKEAVPLIVQILAALDHVHREKIIHRDVKPSNILVCNGVVKLTDFGIALLPDAPRLTAHQHTIGTPEYMSPEQLQGSNVDHRTDIYSAGLVLYAMLAGHSPFPAREILAAIGQRMTGPPDLRRIVPNLPGGVWEALCMSLEVDPEHRFRSAAAFRDVLKDITAGFLHPALDPEEEISTEVMQNVTPSVAETVATPAETLRRSVIPWIIITGSITVAGYVLVNHGERFPVVAPAVTYDKGVPRLPPVELSPPATTTNAPERVHPTSTEAPPLVIPMPIDDGRAQRDAEEKQRQDIAKLRQEIQFALDRAEATLRTEDFGQVGEELEFAARKAQAYPGDLWQERDEIARLRTELVEARVAAETRKQQEALWAKRLADIEEDLRQERWPEAERFAKQIVDDAQAPADVAARATDLLRQAKEGRIAEFRKTEVGQTKNTFRKPSTPPRRKD